MTRKYRGRRVQSYRPRPRPQGKREEPAKAPLRPGMIQLTVSALILAAAVALKFLSPGLMDQVRDTALRLMGEDTDFVAAFSSLGRALGGDMEETLNDVYVAVFGQQEAEEDPPADTPAPEEQQSLDPISVYTPENTPERAQLFQEVLGFAYADPVAGDISDRFGYRQHPLSGTQRFHYGLDVAAEEGTVVSSFAQGIVSVVGDNAELGKYVEVIHANGYSTLYAHCSRITASSGQSVALGDPIAEVGQTGQATGPHLHFELHRDTVYLNPIYYVNCV